MKHRQKIELLCIEFSKILGFTVERDDLLTVNINKRNPFDQFQSLNKILKSICPNIPYLEYCDIGVVCIRHYDDGIDEEYRINIYDLCDHLIEHKLWSPPEKQEMYR